MLEINETIADLEREEAETKRRADEIAGKLSKARAERQKARVVKVAELMATEHVAFTSLAAYFKIKLAEVTPGTEKPKAEKKDKIRRSPKFFNPEFPEQTWNGVGKPPQWINDNIKKYVTNYPNKPCLLYTSRCV